MATYIAGPFCFAAVEDCLKVEAPHLVLADYVEAMKVSLFSGHPVVALAFKRFRSNNWPMESMPTEGILHTFMLAVAISGISHHNSKVSL